MYDHSNRVIMSYFHIKNILKFHNYSTYLDVLSMMVKICLKRSKKSKEWSTHFVHIFTNINDLRMSNDHDI